MRGCFQNRVYRIDLRAACTAAENPEVTDYLVAADALEDEADPGVEARLLVADSNRMFQIRQR